eukprot:scaffold316488_cov106-Cyclotella_meneghiniana.AAC.1
MEHSWEVHKFGGGECCCACLLHCFCPSSLIIPTSLTHNNVFHNKHTASLADATLYKTVGDLLLSESTQRGPIPTMAIVSARGGMTDLLVKVVSSALSDMSQAELDLENALNGQLDILHQLAPTSITDEIEANMRKDAQDILSVVQSLRMIRSVPPSVMEVVTGFGEIWSAQTLYAYLKAKVGTKVAWLDARDVLIVKCEGNAGLGEKGSSSSTGGVTPVWEVTSKKLEEWWDSVGKVEGVNWDDSLGDDVVEKDAPIVIATGFVATSTEGVPTTLKRSGSDYSATIFAKLLESSRVTMWKNTDGVYTADPRRVPEAFSIDSLKYDEAMELAYFGAQVLHPLAMVPCIDSNIPVYIRNIFNPAFEGTVIQGRCASLKDVNKDGKVVNWRSKKGVVPIKGITSVDKVSLLTLEGASVIGGAEVAERFMGCMADAAIDVLIITQASSESSITVVIPENQCKAALAALRSAFELELSRSNVNAISLSEDTMSIVAIVGEGMAMNSGVSASFMSSLAKANVNIRVIAQGSSERQVAVVVEAKDGMFRLRTHYILFILAHSQLNFVNIASRALRSAHMAFTLSSTMVSVAILGGTGKLGSALIRQLDAQKENLANKLNIGVCVSAIASSTKMRLGINGQCLATNNADDLLGDDADDLDIESLTAHLEADVNPHRVVIDCTNCDRIADMYPFWMASGINVISPNRNAGAGPLARYNAIRDAQRANSVEWQCESSVGSALPILTTLRDLMQTGDDVKLLRGCLSGTMAYVFSTMNEEVSFTDAVQQAIEKDYTENDIREDLSGSDAV